MKKISIQNEDLITFSDGRARIRRNNKWGFIDQEWNIIVPPKYEEISDFENGSAIVRTKENSYCINEQGKIIAKIN